MVTLPRISIWQAPTSSIAGPELAAAVSGAGAMGAMALTWTEPDVAAAHVRSVLASTANPFYVNFALAFPPTALDAVLDAGVPILTFSWGDPERYLPRVRAARVPFGIQVTNVAGASRAIDLGAAFLVCQGVEAGGHVQSSTPLEELLPSIIDAAGQVPVVAAGGIATGAQVAQVLNRGATGAMLGTRFVATRESRAHDDYKQRLVAAHGETALTVCFDGGWSYSAHRVLRNSTLEAWEAAGCPPAGTRPGEGEVIGRNADGEPIIRYDMVAPRLGYTGELEAMCLYSGTSCRDIHDIPSAGDLVRRLWQEAQQVA